MKGTSRSSLDPRDVVTRNRSHVPPLPTNCSNERGWSSAGPAGPSAPGSRDTARPRSAEEQPREVAAQGRGAARGQLPPSPLCPSHPSPPTRKAPASSTPGHARVFVICEVFLLGARVPASVLGGARGALPDSPWPTPPFLAEPAPQRILRRSFVLLELEAIASLWVPGRGGMSSVVRTGMCGRSVLKQCRRRACVCTQAGLFPCLCHILL